MGIIQSVFLQFNSFLCCLLIIFLFQRVLKNVITKKNIMSKLVSGSVKPSDLASKAALDRFVLVNNN
jgi:hypothetical protein